VCCVFVETAIPVARFLTGHSQQKFPVNSNLLLHRNAKNYTLYYFIAYFKKTQDLL
jgi:hypothetical protein